MNACLASILFAAAAVAAAGAQEQGGVSFGSPGLPPSQLDAAGRLVEDWGALEVSVCGEGLPVASGVKVTAFTLDEVIPAARATWTQAPVLVELTAWRAPAWPAGLDVVTVRVQETGGAEQRVTLSLVLPEGATVGERSVKIHGRRVMLLPEYPEGDSELREWGSSDEGTSLPGWATPRPGGHDPAFANIRAGMGGVPLVYRFAVESGEAADVVLGFCESYWREPGSRMMNCKVEGAPVRPLDPLAEWGRHQPGGVLLEGSDENSDGYLDVLVLPAPGTPDRNPILNALWLFAPGQELDPQQVITGRLNALALRYVDVGGERDQSIHPPRKLEFPVTLEAGGSRELTFLVACPGATAPDPDQTAWTEAALRKAAREVAEAWRDQ